MWKFDFVHFAALSVNLMSMVAGFGYGWASPYIPKLNGNVDPDNNPLTFPTTLIEDSWITSLQSLGAICGPLFTGYVSNLLGKKIALLIFALPLMMSSVIMIFANTVTHFYISRFLLGVGTGSVYSLIPIYIAEIAQVSSRGGTILILPLTVTAGQLFVYIIGPFVTIRTIAIISLMPSILFLLIFGIFVPESPYFLVLQNKMEEAENSLKKLRQKTDVQKELLEVIKDVNGTQIETSFKDIFKSRTVRKCLLVALGLMFFEQFSGVLAILSYQQTIFDSADGILPGDKSVMLVGTVQLVTVVVVTKLINHVGRKKLLILSYSGAFISLLSLGLYFYFQERGFDVHIVSWLPITTVSIYIACFNLGIGPVAWTIIGEIFPANLKSYLSSFSCFFLFLLGYLNTMLFPTLTVYLGMAWSLWIFVIFLACGVIFIILVLPETKDKTFLEIQLILEGNKMT